MNVKEGLSRSRIIRKEEGERKGGKDTEGEEHLSVHLYKHTL
jgi:hypothetical protein